MIEVYTVYKTDNQHSFNYRNLIGIVPINDPHRVFFDIINICVQQAMKEGETLSGDQLNTLVNLSYTQEYKGEGEFFIEKVSTFQLLSI